MGADNKYRAVGGPQSLTTPKCDNPLFDAFFESVQEAGYTLTDDVNGYQQEGFSKFDATIYRRRQSAARAYVHPVLNRKNHRYLQGQSPQNSFEGKRAVGVRYKKGFFTRDVYCNKEVASCGGAINSPAFSFLVLATRNI